MTAAHLPGAILTPRYRGARAVASFNVAERHGATNQIQRIPVGQLSGSANAAHGFCLAVGSAAPFNFNAAEFGNATPLTCRVPTSDAKVRGENCAKPAALSNAVSNAERPSHGCPVGYRDNLMAATARLLTIAQQLADEMANAGLGEPQTVAPRGRK